MIYNGIHFDTIRKELKVGNRKAIIYTEILLLRIFDNLRNKRELKF